MGDITFIPTYTGFLFLAVVLDAWSRRIIGWSMALHLRTELVLDALEMALAQRRPENVIHHTDHGSQYTSLAFGQRCREAGVRPSMGTVGDAYDNAAAESLIGLYKTEAIRPDSPFRTGPLNDASDVEYVTASWVHWYNAERIHTKAGNMAPIKAENQYYQNSAQHRAAA